MFNIIRKEVKIGDHVISLETGKIARQAHGSIVARMGNTVVLCTAVGKKEASNIGFFPLSVHYQEKFYADGRVPGGFIKRESKPSERETLISRLIDRPIRPLFPKGYNNEVQVICTVMSYDNEHEPDIIALIGASAALAISGIPFSEPIAAVRVGYKDGDFILNPNLEQLVDSELDLVVAGTKSSVLMVESEAKELSEETMLEAIMFGHNSFQPVIEAIDEMVASVGTTAWEVVIPDLKDLKTKIKKLAAEKIEKAYLITNKTQRTEELKNITNEIKKTFVAEEEYEDKDVATCIKDLEKYIVRNKIVHSKKRIDDRKYDEIRPIECELDILPMVHGSTLFTRGETQAIGALTLGTAQDAQMIDDLAGVRHSNFMLHYNFPPYSVGECSMMRAPGRREIGHGKLASRAIKNMLPKLEDFPYTIRMVSEVTESNGSSSMATVCASSLALMASGVPVKDAVAGIAMGLIKEKEDFVVLSDIMGDEDYLGDMDFKVAGSNQGITALQMDIKINGINEIIMKQALEQAKLGRSHILNIMNKTIAEPRKELHARAPRIEVIEIPKEKIRDVIGAGGKTIKDICEKASAKIDISDDGMVSVAAFSGDDMKLAMQMIKDATTTPKVGDIYDGVVTKIMDFGIILQILGGNVSGLVHISELSEEKVDDVASLYSEGDQVKIKIVGFDRGKYKFSIKALSLPNSSIKRPKKIDSNKKTKISSQDKRSDSEQEEITSKPKKKLRFF